MALTPRGNEERCLREGCRKTGADLTTIDCEVGLGDMALRLTLPVCHEDKALLQADMLGPWAVTAPVKRATPAAPPHATRNVDPPEGSRFYITQGLRAEREVDAPTYASAQARCHVDGGLRDFSVTVGEHTITGRIEAP